MKKSYPDKKLTRALLLSIIALAWPTMLEQILQTAVQYIDTAMVGALGTQATAAVGSTTTTGSSEVPSPHSVSAFFPIFLRQKAQAIQNASGALPCSPSWQH